MNIQFRSSVAAACLCAGLGLMPAAQAQQPPCPGYGYGPCGMGQQFTPDQQRQMGENMQRWGYGPGMMGPGMMGGYGPGYGMGMGPGMMGGYGAGMGPGMMGGWADLKLSEKQKAQLDNIHDNLQEKHRKLMGQMWQEQAKLGELYNAEKPDPSAIGKVHERIFKLQREALEARIDAENKSMDVLTKEQKDQLRRGRGWGMMGY